MQPANFTMKTCLTVVLCLLLCSSASGQESGIAINLTSTATPEDTPFTPGITYFSEIRPRALIVGGVYLSAAVRPALFAGGLFNPWTDSRFSAVFGGVLRVGSSETDLPIIPVPVLGLRLQVIERAGFYATAGANVVMFGFTISPL